MALQSLISTASSGFSGGFDTVKLVIHVLGEPDHGCEGPPAGSSVFGAVIGFMDKAAGKTEGSSVSMSSVSPSASALSSFALGMT